MYSRVHILRFIFLLSTILLAGCSATATKKPVVYWPPPPNEPRLQWIDTVYSEDDFAKTSSQAASEKLIGNPPLTFFSKPTGIAADGSGKVFISDLDEGTVRIFDFGVSQIRSLSRQAVLRLPIGVALDKEGRLYVADGGSSVVAVFSQDGTPLFTFGNRDLLKKPAFVAVNDRLGRIYVTDSQGHEVAVFDKQGKHLFSFGKRGNGEGFNSPMGIAIDGQDRVFVADMLNARVVVSDAEGKFLKAFGERGDLEWQFEAPRGVAFDSEGHLYVTDGRKPGLMIFEADGTPLLVLAGGVSDHPLGFAMPTGIWIDPNDRIYITDPLNRRFVIWQYLSEKYRRDHPIDKEALQELEEKIKKRGGAVDR